MLTSSTSKAWQQPLSRLQATQHTSTRVISSWARTITAPSCLRSCHHMPPCPPLQVKSHVYSKIKKQIFKARVLSCRACECPMKSCIANRTRPCTNFVMSHMHEVRYYDLDRRWIKIQYICMLSIAEIHIKRTIWTIQLIIYNIDRLIEMAYLYICTLNKFLRKKKTWWISIQI